MISLFSTFIFALSFVIYLKRKSSRVIIISCFKAEVILKRNPCFFNFSQNLKQCQMFAKLESKILGENLISKFPKGHVKANEEGKFN